MHAYRSQVAILSRLHELASAAEVKAAFRQGMASLAQVAVDPAAVPFEGCPPERLRESVRTALSEGLLDDLSFLSPGRAGCALYALASAVPAHTAERRELGRQVRATLAEGGAEGFVSLATPLALSGARALDGPLMAARIELVLELPAGESLRVDALAFALLARPELAARFVLDASRSHLPARRTAARLLERAARYAVLRAQQGDDGELARFEAPALVAVFERLLRDHEPLVFRHLASARGLLSAQLMQHAEEVEHDLGAPSSRSRVRRGATSLAARIAVRPAEALARARELLLGPLASRDAGIAAALIHGLPRAFDTEPEAAEELLLLALERGGLLALEALSELWRELGGRRPSDAVGQAVRRQLAQCVDRPSTDDGQLELLASLREELELSSGPRKPPQLAELIRDALRAHARLGPQAAGPLAAQALALATRRQARLAELVGASGSEVRREVFRLVHELERGLLESASLRDLCATAQPQSSAADPVTSLLGELARTLVALESAPHAGGPVPHLTLRLRCLRALLHVLDGGLAPGEEQALTIREGQLAAVRALCERVALDSPSAMDRIVHAALARGADALLRDELLELGEVVLCLSRSVPLAEGLLVVAEGSLLPDVTRALRAVAALMQAGGEPGVGGARRAVGALSDLAQALPSDESPRTEALRRALLALSRGAQAVLGARSIRELVRSRRALALLEGGARELVQLAAGAARRLGLAPRSFDERSSAALTRAIESGAAHASLDELAPSIAWLGRELEQALPAAFARAIVRVLETLPDKPLAGGEHDSVEPLAPATAEARPLPAWVPPSRRLGAYYVLRALGTGPAVSAFLVRRTEQRFERGMKELVLKVARYDAQHARELGQAEFEASFARELPALLSVPPHENLAAIVAVEPSAVPKPFLVMEWIEGPMLARVRKRKLPALAVIDGILAGLDALHAHGIGHLDVAPENVLLRARGSALVPVLVDYACAGRSVRRGVGRAAYAAPEQWTLAESTPMAVDVYAVGCLAYELIVGHELFQADTPEQLRALHLGHDGAPPGVAELAEDPRTVALAEWLGRALRSQPSARASAAELRAALGHALPT